MNTIKKIKTLKESEEGESVRVEIVPTREITYKYDNGFGAYVCEIAENENKIEILNITGVFSRPLDLGQTYEVEGQVKIYEGKKQIFKNKIKKIMPTTKRGIISFLKSLKGVGYVADIIYEEYGEESLKVIKERPLDLVSLTPTLYDDLVLSWKKQIDELKDDYDSIVRLMNLGLKAYQAKGLYNIYNESIFSKLEDNPYFLSREIKGYSFLKCDKIAQELGIHPEDNQRLMEGIMYYINSMSFNGDTCFELSKIIEESQRKLSINIGIREMNKLFKNIKNNSIVYKYGKLSFVIKKENLIKSIENYKNSKNKYEKERAKFEVYKISEKKLKEAIKLLILEERLVLENDRIYEKDIYIKEAQLAANIVNIIKSSQELKDVNVENIVDEYLSKNNINLEKKQKEAVIAVASEIGGITIINGGAGCGKTFSMKTSLAILEKIYKKQNSFFEKILIAPTGRASKVIEESTGMKAFTIHRALGYNPNLGYNYNSKNRLPYDCIVIDESSMLDTELAYHLFSSISPKSKVIIMGDIEQLPSIGPGNVLRDLIESNKIKVITLDVVKRQGLYSGIIKNSNRIINGEMITTMKESNDAFVLKGVEHEETHSKLFKMISNLKKSYSLSDIQVLTPQKTGPNGTNYLNFIIQKYLNPDNNEIKFLSNENSISVKNENIKYKLYFKKGDKVIHTTNNYNIEWYHIENGRLILDTENLGITNGETGIIVKLIKSKGEYNEDINKIVVKYNDKFVVYIDDFSEIEHAYALTIHKSQGSEWPAVIMIISEANRIMLERNLIYTGYTRAKTISISIIDPYLVKLAIDTQKTINRKTGLKEKILELY